jgi:pSer/pThr/pTyr-binding forkhead associated (FHA) protein/subtilisin family serine protease
MKRRPYVIQVLQTRRWLLVGVGAMGLVAVVFSLTALWTLTRAQAGWGGWLASIAPTASPSPPAITPPGSLKDLSAQYPELADLLEEPSLGSVYKDFIIAYQDGGVDAARALASRRGLLNERDEIRITLVMDSAEHVSAVVAELRGAAITVEGSYKERINVGVPLSLIEKLSVEQGVHALFEQLTEIEHIIRLELPLPNRPDRVVRLQGEGVTITGADAWQAAGYTGRGIRIGVLDLGFDGYEGLLGSELPSNVTARSFVYGEEPDGNGEVHGTACAEIVHEMAPDAELFLAYYDGTGVSEGQAVEWLKEQDVHIISHSAGSVMAPMDGTGEDAELADETAAQGILWVNSAGNEAEGHYRGQFSDSDGDGLHEFPDGGEEIALESFSSEMTVVLNWDDWDAVTEDYDLYVYDAQGTQVATGEDTQDGSPGQIPAEGLIVYETLEKTYYVSIVAYETSRPAMLDLYALGASIEFPVSEYSLNTPGDARGSLTVGATEYRDDRVASYSSQGPTTDGRLKPDISAPAGVSGATYGSEMFDGTSASAPHVAGAAALVWSVFPDLGRDDVATYLTSHAKDLGPPGPDTGYGHGRLQLPSPPEGGLELALPESTDQPPLLQVAGTLVPTVAPMLTAGPPASPVADQPEATEVWSSPIPGQQVASSAPSYPSSVLLIGLSMLGLCGGVAFLGGTGLLLLARQRARTVPSQPATFPTPSLPLIQPVDLGRLTAIGEAPIPLRAGTITLGRGSENDVVLSSPNVSRRHAQIACKDGRCGVEDLGSSNGTFVDGERVSRATLRPGCRLRLGDVVLAYDAPDRRQQGTWLEIGGQRYPVPPAGVIVGRSSDSDIRLGDGLASRRHARIDRQEPGFVITDLGSTNGTFVNERPVRRQLLRDGDELRMGETRLRFRRADGA